MRFTAFYLYMYIFGVTYAGNIYVILIVQETVLIRLKKNPGFFIISSLILSSHHLYERTGN